MSDSILAMFVGRGRKARIVPPPGPREFVPLLPLEDTDEETAQPEDGSEDVARGEHLIGEHLIIRYVNAKGEESQRRIALHCVYERSGTDYVRAYCYERLAARTFRKDRILEIIDSESGEIIENLEKIAEAIADRGRPVDSLEATKRAFQLNKQGILILLFLARCDGLVHSSEEEVLLNYIDDDCADKGVDESYALKRLKRLSPDPISYENAIRHMARFNKKEFDRVARFARRLIEADGAISPEETEFAMALQEFFSD